MQVKIGSSLKLRGREYVCVEIEQRKSQCIARIDSATMLADTVNPINVRYVTKNIETFSEGDIINIEAERVQFEAIGADVLFFYTKFNVTKERSDGQQGVEGGADKAANSTAQAVDERLAGGASTGG